MSRDWFDEWLDSDESDEFDLDEPRRPLSMIELALLALVGGLVAVVLIVCAIAVLFLVLGGITLLWEEFAITKWLLLVAVVFGFLYWDKKASRGR